ncbi:MAG TPA: hypothetical protein VI728_04845 [Syntrophales bacterium]|nr:hypothetical protein [Syntrophales bacterium]
MLKFVKTAERVALAEGAPSIPFSSIIASSHSSVSLSDLLANIKGQGALVGPVP